MPARIDGVSRDWADRAGRYKSIQIHRDLADMLRDIAKADDTSIAKIIDGLMRATVEERYRQVIKAKLDKVKPPRRGSARR